MTTSKISLGGQNSRGRTSGARSSRASSTLFKKLQKLDRKITQLQAWQDSYNRIPQIFKNYSDTITSLDRERKELRQLRKCHQK